MPANKKHTNKTAHVLNVITAGRETAEETPVTAPVSPPAALPETVVMPAPVVAPIVPVVEVEHAPEELSNQIREALREAVEQEEKDAFSPLQPEVIKTESYTDPSSSSAPVPPSPAVPPSSSMGRPTSVEVAHPTLDGELQVPPEASRESEYINVMQVLVREKVPKYIKLLGVCSCSRCQADVEALALSHLEPKYIVLQKCQRFPYSVYENHYNVTVTSQIISACRVVMEKPRH
ncbi:late competence development ComFB family protein [Oscillibacter sp.]|uniref:late competence development ComFB family protein n=1 Tax=Oscillibacter sp. TaxID=1945593 RepID=UPI0028AEC0F9|nr:late competence development ComFB family protein [Oscillibacter sp.]